MGTDLIGWVEFYTSDIDGWRCTEDIGVNFPYCDGAYAKYAILADVRNHGRGDCRFNPISHARGLPADVSDYGRQEAMHGDHAGHDHHHSFVTLSELVAFDWKQTVVRKGLLTPEQFASLKDEAKAPQEWVDWAMKPDKYIRASWVVTYEDAVGKHFMDTIHELTLFALEHGLPHCAVRLVFFFAF